MEATEYHFSTDKKEMYRELAIQMKALIVDVPHLIANLSNASALLNQALDQINWVGFYWMEEGKLVLGPFQGKPACIDIKVGRGVCGNAVSQNQTMRVQDVHAFPGHIPCDAASRSEIVVPLHKNGEVVGVLDIDSPYEGRFDEIDQQGLEVIAGIIEATL